MSLTGKGMDLIEDVIKGERRRDTMNNRRSRVCPVELAGSLDNRIRRWLQDPKKIMSPYVRKGMKVVDLGCGPGFFTIDLAEMVGKTGSVIAIDLQEGMLRKIKSKIQGTDLEERIILHQCMANGIGLSLEVDFILAFYMVHEVPNKQALFKEISLLLKPGGKIFIVEPPFHVSKAGFEEMIKTANLAGLKSVERPKMLFHKAVVMQKQK